MDRRTRETKPSGEQISAGLREFHVAARPMPGQPALFNRTLDARTILIRATASAKEGQIDQLDKNALPMISFRRVRDFDYLERPGH